MNEKINLLCTQHDLALNLCVAEDAHGAIEASVAAFGSLFPDWGICILARTGNATFGECAGNLAESARRISEGTECPGEADRALLFARRDPENGFSLDMTTIACVGERPDVNAVRCLERMGCALEATLRRIERTRLLAEALRNSELMTREARHRIKNSFQYFFNTISLFMPSDSVLPPFDRDMLEQRISAFISIHDLLDGVAGGSGVSAEAYIFRLAETLRTLLMDCSGSFAARWEASEPLHFTTTRATTIGLIVHELVMNSIKHARGRRVNMILSAGRQGDDLEMRYYDEAEDGDAAAGRDEAAEPAPACYVKHEGTGMGLKIVRELLLRAGGRRMDEGLSPHLFIARFPVTSVTKIGDDSLPPLSQSPTPDSAEREMGQ